MKRFVWRLQRVLDIKVKEEQAKKTELFELTEKLTQTRQKFLTQQRILNDMISDISKKSPQRRLADQELFLKHSTTIDQKIALLKNQIGELESQQRKKIIELLRVRQFKQGLERLRSEAKKQFIMEQEKIEQKNLDETATISFTRKNHATLDRALN